MIQIQISVQKERTILLPFQIIRNDVTRVAADAIVNSAAPKPLVGLGTDYAIHKAAGPELLEARKKIGDIQTGQSFATPAFQLQAKYARTKLVSLYPEL